MASVTSQCSTEAWPKRTTMKANLMGCVHGSAQCPHELWTGKHPNVLKLPMISFGSVVMAHIPLDQQTIDGSRSILHYAVGTAVGHPSGLRLISPATKRVVIQRTYKALRPGPQPNTKPEYEIVEEGDATETSVSVETPDVSKMMMTANISSALCI